MLLDLIGPRSDVSHMSTRQKALTLGFPAALLEIVRERRGIFSSPRPDALFLRQTLPPLLQSRNDLCLPCLIDFLVYYIITHKNVNALELAH